MPEALCCKSPIELGSATALWYHKYIFLTQSGSLIVMPTKGCNFYLHI